MKALKERILRDGKCFEGGILKVDNFINHQMDPILMKSIAVEFVRRFASTNINKVMTIEASGIAPAIMVGYLLELPVVFAKKKKPVTMENMLTTSVYSFTKDRSYDVCVSKDFLSKGDRVLFIDDFLANGNAAKGIIDLVEKAGAELSGMGFIIEKAFQHGGDYLRNAGIRVESLAITESLDNCEIKIRESHAGISNRPIQYRTDLRIERPPSCTRGHFCRHTAFACYFCSHHYSASYHRWSIKTGFGNDQFPSIHVSLCLRYFYLYPM